MDVEHDCDLTGKMLNGKMQLSCKKCACDFCKAMGTSEMCSHVMCRVGKELELQIAEAKACLLHEQKSQSVFIAQNELHKRD